MERKFGFTDLYQPDIGIVECGKSLLLSLHPLMFPFSMNHSNLFSFCSYYYNPSAFFDRVETTLRQLSKEKNPFLLVVHSCVSHQGLISHLPARKIGLREEISGNQMREHLTENFRLAIREADRFLDKILSATQSLTPGHRPYIFFFGDHGSRVVMDEASIQYVHLDGPPLSRYQYNVPLGVLTPDGRFSGMHYDGLVSLMDLYPTILALSGWTGHKGYPLPVILPDYALRKQLLLVSSMELPDDHGIQLENEMFLDARGLVHYSLELEKVLNSTSSLALVQLPFRWHYSKNGEIALYHELTDPHNLRNIAKSFPRVARRFSLQRKNIN